MPTIGLFKHAGLVLCSLGLCGTLGCSSANDPTGAPSVAPSVAEEHPLAVTAAAGMSAVHTAFKLAPAAVTGNTPSHGNSAGRTSKGNVAPYVPTPDTEDTGSLDVQSGN
jgi:hypothetical protein